MSYDLQHISDLGLGVAFRFMNFVSKRRSRYSALCWASLSPNPSRASGFSVFKR